jgi:hypothetical protein
MPKVASSINNKVAAYLKEFQNETFQSDGKVLYCKCCEKSVSIAQRFQVSQHISTTKHKQNKERQNKFKQQFLTSSPSTSSDDNSSTFYTDLCRAFIRADIPIFKLKNPALKDFLEQYTGKTIPDESTIRKKYVNVIYEETLTSIRQNIQDGPIWVSIDESTDADGRYVGNVIVGKLSSEPSNSFLLNCEQLDKCNHKTIAKLFNDSMNLLWTEGVKYENVFLFLSDAAPYMCKAGNVLNAFFPKLIHVTCLAHGFHRVAETIRSSYPDVDQLISTVKKIFLKAPSRVLKFKELYPDLNLPPEPILTRWGTWLEAALYYCENFEKIKNIISNLNTETATAIDKANNLMENNNLKNNLTYISANFGFLIHTIKQLETRNMPLSESLCIVEESQKKLEKCQGRIGNVVREKCKYVIEKNHGLKNLKIIKDILQGLNPTELLDVELTPLDVVNMKYAIITSVDVERSFSQYKNILRPNRRHFTFLNLREYVVSHCFNN